MSIDIFYLIKQVIKNNPDKIIIKLEKDMDFIGRVTVPEKDSIYVYANPDQNTASIKIGDGNSFLIDLPTITTIIYSDLLGFIKDVKEE